MIHRLVFCLPIALAAVGLAAGVIPAAVAQQHAAAPVDDLIRVLTSRDAFSEECASASRDLAARAAESVPVLVQQLPAAGELGQLRILAALSRMGPAASPALPEVRRLLREGTPCVRTASADCLRGMGEAGREALPDLFKALGDPDPITVGTAARAIDALDPAFVATRLKDLLDRLGSSPASVDRLQLGMWYCIACRQADDADLAPDLRHWMLVVRFTGREDVLVGEILGPMELQSGNAQAALR
jgi:HEAT repeat protein